MVTQNDCATPPEKEGFFQWTYLNFFLFIDIYFVEGDGIQNMPNPICHGLTRGWWNWSQISARNINTKSRYLAEIARVLFKLIRCLVNPQLAARDLVNLDRIPVDSIRFLSLFIFHWTSDRSFSLSSSTSKLLTPCAKLFRTHTTLGVNITKKKHIIRK